MKDLDGYTIIGANKIVKQIRIYKRIKENEN